MARSLGPGPLPDVRGVLKHQQSQKQEISLARPSSTGEVVSRSPTQTHLLGNEVSLPLHPSRPVCGCPFALFRPHRAQYVHPGLDLHGMACACARRTAAALGAGAAEQGSRSVVPPFFGPVPREDQEGKGVHGIRMSRSDLDRF